MTMRLLGIVLLLGGARGLSAQEAALPPLMPENEEIRLARSAAPPEISDGATVYVLRRGGYVKAVEGTNGVSCLVDRSHVESREPHCFDREGSETIIPRRLLRAKLREQGRSPEEIEAELARKVDAGELRDPSRPVLSWMMSAGQVLYQGSRRVGQWRPHIMIYYPDLTNEALGLPETPSPPVMLFGDDEDLPSILVVVEEFVEVEAGQGG